MSKSDEGPQSLSHKMLEVVHSACQETQQVLSELSTVGGGGGTKTLSLFSRANGLLKLVIENPPSILPQQNCGDFAQTFLASEDLYSRPPRLS